jgi:hypothetical protein
VIEHNHEVGVFVSNSGATIEASVVRATQPTSMDIGGHGIDVYSEPVPGSPATLVLRTALVEQHRESSVLVSSAEATIEATVIRATALGSTEPYGRGLTVQPHSMMISVPSTLSMTTSLIEDSHEVGLSISASTGTVESTAVRNALRASGRGVAVEAEDTTLAPSAVSFGACVVEGGYGVGFLVSGSEVTLDTSVVRGTRADTITLGGNGVSVQDDVSTDATLALHGSLIEQNSAGGVIVADADATVGWSLIRDSATDLEGQLGDGIVVLGLNDSASAAITATRIERSARAAVAAFGGRVSLHGSALACQAFDLNRENVLGNTGVFEDLGQNGCGCPEATQPCKAVSANLQPPSPVAPTPP